MSRFYQQIIALGAVMGMVVATPASSFAQGLGLGLGIAGAAAKTYDHTLDAKLVQAVRAANLAEVQSLLKRGADPSAKDTDTYKTPALGLAAGENYNLEILRALLAAGADREVTNSQGATALVSCSVDSHPESIKELLQAGAKIEATTTDGLTALMVASSAGELENVRILLAAGANVNALSQSKGTALIYGSAKTIAGTGKLEIIKALVEAGADVGVKATNGKNAVATAQDYGLDDIASYLTTIYNRDNALFNAVAHAYTERSTAGTTAWEAVKTALAAGANPHFTVEDGRTELMFLAYGVPGCDEETMKRFVAHSDVNAQEQQFGATALHLAVDNNNIAMAILLVKAGASPTIRKKDGQTPLDMAKVKGNKDIMDLIIAIESPKATTDPDDDDDDDTPAVPYFV